MTRTELVYRCVTCGTTYQARWPDDSILEIYAPGEGEWSMDCPFCGCPVCAEGLEEETDAE